MSVRQQKRNMRNLTMLFNTTMNNYILEEKVIEPSIIEIRELRKENKAKRKAIARKKRLESITTINNNLRIGRCNENFRKFNDNNTSFG